MTTRVYPVTAEDFEKDEQRNSDLNDFLLNQAEIKKFLKCIANDSVEDLKEASKHLDWTAFLQSSDVSGVWSDCSPQFVHTFAIGDSTHPFPTNPFFVAIFYNAQKCLTFMHKSGVDFSNITEHGFTAYHILLSAIRFMSHDHREHVNMHGAAADSQVSSECSNLVSLFHDTLFTSEQQQQMLQSVCRFGMTPMSWGVYLGLANHVEYIMRYYSSDTMVQSDAVGLNERISVDVSEFVGENPSFFTSPICVLLDLYGQNDLAEIKALGIFRSGFIWRQWVEALYNRNWTLTRVIILQALLMTFATAFYSGSSIDSYLRNRCAFNNAAFPYGMVTVLLSWSLTCLLALSIFCWGLLRKELYRRHKGYPMTTRKSIKEMMFWYIPYFFALPISLFLLWLYLDTERGCALLGDQVYPINGFCIMLLLITSFTLDIGFLRHIVAISTMISCLYKSIMDFTFFTMLYILLTAVCARMFQSSLAFSMSIKGNNSSVTAPDDLTEFLKAFYQTFLVSINVIDTNVFAPSGDRIDLNIAHVCYVLIVPILFINFAIGVLSSTVTYVHENKVENLYMTMLTAAEFMETNMFFFYSLVRKFRGPKKILVGICEPVTQKSKLMSRQGDSLASLLRKRDTIICDV